MTIVMNLLKKAHVKTLRRKEAKKKPGVFAPLHKFFPQAQV